MGIAPKTYALQLSNGSHIFRAKGITLNKKNASKLTFQTLKDMAEKRESYGSLSFEVPFCVIRNKQTGILKSVSQTKNMSFKFDKRYLSENSVVSYPYGFGKDAYI